MSDVSNHGQTGGDLWPGPCSCREHCGDNPDCPQHGNALKQRFTEAAAAQVEGGGWSVVFGSLGTKRFVRRNEAGQLEQADYEAGPWTAVGVSLEHPPIVSVDYVSVPHPDGGGYLFVGHDAAKHAEMLKEAMRQDELPEPDVTR